MKVVLIDRDDIRLGTYRGQPPLVGERLVLTPNEGGFYRQTATSAFEVMERRWKVDALGHGTVFVTLSQIG